MKLEKEFTIFEVSARNFINAPFEFVLEDREFRLRKQNVLIMNQATLDYYHIPFSLDLVGKKIICSFISRKSETTEAHPFDHIGKLEFMPPQNKKRKRTKEIIQDDDLKIKTLVKSESYATIGSLVLQEMRKVEILLELISFGEGDGLHFHPLPCPFYHFFLTLTEEEYKECQLLPSNIIFKVSFSLRY